MVMRCHVTEVAILMEGEWQCYILTLLEGEWSCYKFNGGRIVILPCLKLYSTIRWPMFNGGRMVMLLRWSVQWRENGVYMERERSCYGGGQFNRGRMVMLRRWSV